MRALSARSSFNFFLAILLIFLGINVWMVAPYLLAVLMGGILAILTRPLYRRFLHVRMGRKLSASLVILFILTAVIGPLWAFGTIAVQQGIAFSQNLSIDGASVQAWLDRASRMPLLKTAIGDPEQVQAQVRSGLKAVGAQASGMLLSTVGGLPNKVLQIALALIACFFFLVDGPRFLSWLNEKTPLEPRARQQLYDSFRDTTISTIWATLAAAGSQSAVIFIGFVTLGVPAAFLAAGATFLFAWVPLVGSTPVWIAGMIYLYTQGSLLKMFAMLGVGIITGVTDNFVRPLVLKGRSDMHPLVSLVAIFGGIQMFGLFGVFFGPILAAVLLALLRVWPEIYGRKRTSEKTEERQLSKTA